MAVREVDIEVPSGAIQGRVDDRFGEVAAEFERNFAEREEVGASVCVRVHGETVVDLWGGSAGPGAAWSADTMTVTFSCTKGATALCAHVLVDRGLLDLDAPVAEYWPEFAANGKERATVRMMLDHSVGVPALREKLANGAACDWDLMVSLLEAEAPFWTPGERNGYHMLTFGWTVGELVRRVSGRSLGTFFRDEIAQPRGVEFWIGLPEELEAKVAPVIYHVPDPATPSAFTQAIKADRSSVSALALLNQGRLNVNTREAHAAEIGGAGGVGNGRGLAGMYAAFVEDGLVGPDTLARMGEVAVATEADATLLLPTRFGLGFMKSMDNRRRRSGDRESVILSSGAFGHVGAGGSIGFADPAEGLSFGYAMNRHGAGVLLNERGQSLVDAAYRALGYTSDAAGVWRR